MFEGIITPVITPFYEEGEQDINYEALNDLIEHLIKHGVSGIFILGSNGEFFVMDEDEKVQLCKRTVEIVNGRVPVYAGAGCCSTKETVRLAKRLEAAGADALSVITPYFFKPEEDDLYEHFKVVAEAVDIPVLLYNIPKATGCPISVALADRLADIANIQAIKDSSGNMESLKGYADIASRKDFKLLVGSDSKITDAYHLGASGAVAGTSNVITETVVQLDKALRQGDEEAAVVLQKDIDVIRGVLPLGTVPSVMKRGVELAGICAAGPARKPVQPLASWKDEPILEALAYYELGAKG
jgi:4-hydroxy-tetrahydrodipicolinate synthase